MRGLFWLVILMIGGFAMMREKLDNKKYPDTSQARQARQNKLFSEMKKWRKDMGNTQNKHKLPDKDFKTVNEHRHWSGSTSKD